MTNTEQTPPQPPSGEPEPPKKLHRSRSNRWIAGVSGGLAEYFGLHPAVYRILFVALAFAGGTGLLLYIAAALVMPDEGADESVLSETLRRHRHRPWLVIVLALLALALVFAMFDGPGDGGDGIGWLLLIGIGGFVAFLWSRAARRDRRRAEATGRPSARWRTTAVVGLVVVLLAALAGAGVTAAHVEGGVGERAERPIHVGDLEDEYRLGVGDFELDLRELELPSGETHVRTSVEFGELNVIVPEDVAVRVKADIGWGEASILGHETDGRDIRVDIEDPAFDGAETRLVVEADLRAGELRVGR